MSKAELHSHGGATRRWNISIDRWVKMKGPVTSSIGGLTAASYMQARAYCHHTGSCREGEWLRYNNVKREWGSARDVPAFIRVDLALMRATDKLSIVNGLCNKLMCRLSHTPSCLVWVTMVGWVTPSLLVWWLWVEGTVSHIIMVNVTHAVYILLFVQNEGV